MNKRKAYTGIDYFRFLAALLVVAIHTSPLLSYSAMGDFVLTRILARVAVPFFFLTSGFFLFSGDSFQSDRWKAFVKKTAAVYMMAILLYLPLNIYNGYFAQDYLLPNIIKDLFFDGTMYHLWYLPASIFGALIGWFLVKRMGLQRAFVITTLLYLIGLFGDSYYGVSQQLPFLKSVYEAIFQISDYTRNGIFFAPVFFVMGGMLADQSKRASLRASIAGLAASLVLLLGEGLLLHHFGLQRHDSMYLSLLPCMYFLFNALIYWKGQRVALLRTSALIIYIIHPMVIVVVRLFAKVVHLQRIMVENSLIHFLLVSTLSVFVAFLIAILFGKSKKKAISGDHGEKKAESQNGFEISAMEDGSEKRGICEDRAEQWGMSEDESEQWGRCEDQLEQWDMSDDLSARWGVCDDQPEQRAMFGDQGNTKAYRAWIELDLKNLEHNVKILRQAMPENCKIMAVVKAEAYGHGASEVTASLNRMGIRAFAVATIEEGIQLRRYGTQGEILILGYTNPLRAKDLYQYDLSQTLVDYDHAEGFHKQGYQLKVHMKVDTGMHRLGFDGKDTAKMIRVFTAMNFKVEGIYSHLCVADSRLPEDIDFTNSQIQSFYGLLDTLKEKGITLPKIHIQSSYGFLNYPELKCNYVRAGVALYGVLSSPGDKTKLELDLRPVLSLKSQVILTREIKKGDTVGYGRAFIATRDSRIAIVSIGYADGVPRDLSGGKGIVLIKGWQAPIIGRVCMDQLAIDITERSNITVGDIVTLIGRDDANEVLASEVAEASDTITNEILSRMGSRLKVVVK